MKDLAIITINKMGVLVFEGFQPVHPIWGAFSQFRVNWITQEEVDYSIKWLRKGSTGNMISTLSPNITKIEAPPFKSDLYILKKVNE